MINSGICVKSSTNGEDENDYYEILKDVIELVYLTLPRNKVVAFECEQLDPSVNKDARVHKKLQHCRCLPHQKI